VVGTGAKLDDLRRGAGEVELHVPAVASRVQQLPLERQLVALLVDPAGVDELRARAESGGRRDAARENRIVRDVAEEREVHAHSIAEETCLEPRLGAEDALRL